MLHVLVVMRRLKAVNVVIRLGLVRMEAVVGELGRRWQRRLPKPSMVIGLLLLVLAILVHVATIAGWERHCFVAPASLVLRAGFIWRRAT